MEKQTLSPHELNQYTYCPYQWYFHRVYGQKELRQLAKVRNEKLGLTDTQKSRFVKGEAFHTKDYRRYQRRRLVSWLILLGVFLLVAVLVVKYGLH